MSPQVFHVLLGLSDGPLHGYALIQEIETRTGGEVRLTASTLYDALSRLLDQGLIEEVAGPTDGAGGARGAQARPDARRRYYALTSQGRTASRDEARRLERLLAMARIKRVLSRK
jgi:DNA-binding PadR family transcriptional regulator